MDAVRPEYGVIVTDVALVVHFDQHIAPTVVENPVCGVIGGANDRRFIAQALILAEVEIAENHDHAQTRRRG